MAISKTLPRIFGLTVLTGAGVLAQQGAAQASVALDAATTDSDVAPATAGTPGSHIQVLTEKYAASADAASAKPTAVAAKDVCVGADAIKTVSYTVDGKSVSTLTDTVKQGSKVVVNFVLKDNCADTQLGLAAYQAPSNTYEADKADQQVLVDHQSGTFSADGKTHTLEVTAPTCDFQVDFFTGAVLDKLSATAGYNIPGGNLIDADNGGDVSCVPPIVEPPVRPPVAPPVVTDECPTDAAAQITGYTWTINGVKGFTTLEGNAKAGDKVEVDFNVAAGCDDEELSLASYSAPSASFDESTADQQVLIDSQTGNFGPGEHSLAVNVDACFFQVDFVHGGVLTNLGPEGSDNFYGDRLIESTNGGEECVTPPAPETPDVPVAEVQAETVVAAPQLAITGSSHTDQLIMLGVGLTLMGAAMERASARIRRNAA